MGGGGGGGVGFVQIRCLLLLLLLTEKGILVACPQTMDSGRGVEEG